MENISQLSFLRDSLHYRYFQWVTRIWKIDDFTVDRYDKTTPVNFSLCKYAHVLFWMSLCTIFGFPVLAIGWIHLKVARFIYKVLSLTPVGRAILYALDKPFHWGDALTNVSDEMQEHSCMALMISSVMLILSLFVLVVLLCCTLILCGGGFWLITLIPKIPGALLSALYIIGIAGFYVCWGIGFFMYVFASVMVTIGAVLAKCFGILVTIIPFLIYIFLFLAAVSLVAYGIVILFMKIKPLRDFIMFRINGFKAAYERMETKRGEKKEIKRQKELGELPLTAWEQFWKNAGDGLEKILLRIAQTIGGKFALTKSGLTRVVGTPSLIWNILVSLKNNICPFVKVIEKKEIKAIEK